MTVALVRANREGLLGSVTHYTVRRVTLFIAVPVAAVAGIVILAVVALICAVVIAVIGSAGHGGWADVFENVPWSNSRRGRRRR